jgi:endonuclease YncB( thermonuclease family)
VFDIVGKKEELQLSGVDLVDSVARKSAADYFEKALKEIPLRLKYTPTNIGNDKKKTLQGNLFFKQSASVKIEIVRKGIVPCDTESLPGAQQQAYRGAEAVARSAKAGIWAEHAVAQ